MYLKRICNFKYLGIDINSETDLVTKKHRRITTSGNRFYFSLVQLFKFKKLSGITIIRFYKILITL